jgi:hypothetical protein
MESEDKHNKNKSEVDEASQTEEDDEKLQCRFYRKDFPEENDLVIVRLFLYLKSL